MVLFTDPRQVTNWLDPQEKVYAEQKRQRELHHSQSKEVWRQQEAATFTAGDFDQLLKGLSSLSKTAKQISTDREERKYTDFVKGYEQLKFSDQEKIEQIASETDLSLNDANLLKTLSKSGKISPEALIYLEQQSGSKALRLKRLLGWQTVEKSVATIDSEIEQNLYGIRDNFNEAERTGKVDIFYRNVLTDKLRKLGLNDRFIATHYEAEINKFSNTKGLSSKLDYKKVEFSKDAAERIETFEKLKYSTDPTTAAATFGEFLSKQIRLDPENGRSKAVIFMHRLMKDGKIDGSVIQAIKEGAYKSDVGKTGKDLISDSDWKYIEQGEREYQTAVIIAHNDSWAAKGLAAKTAVIKNEWTQEQFESFLREAKDNGQENQQWYKDLSNININRQNDTVKNAEELSLGTALISGNVEFLKQEKERVTNSTLKDQIQDTIDLLENKQAEFNYSERWIDVKVSEGLNLTLGKDEPLNQRGVKVRNDLLKYFRARFQARITEQHPDPMNEAMNDVKAYWDLHGGNVKVKDSADPNPKAGKFSPTEEGSYENYDAYLGLKRKRRDHTLINPTENDINNYKNRVETARANAASGKGLEIPGKNTLERMLNTPKSILDVEDVIGAWENNAYSAELLIKAKQVGVLPSQLLWMQTNALAKAGLLKNLNTSQLNDFPIKERMVTEKAIDDAIKRSKNPSLLYLYRKVGFENMSQKQKQRLIDLLEKVKIETPSIEAFNQIEQERRPESYTGISY
tara:strand:- start:131 stop:2362 length:2232 start_codon:yes stop_codon:yes gene_type:complete